MSATWDAREFAPGEAAYAVQEYLEMAFSYHVARGRALGGYTLDWIERSARLHPDAALTPYLEASSAAIRAELRSNGHEREQRTFVTDVALDSMFRAAGLPPFFFAEDTAP